MTPRPILGIHHPLDRITVTCCLSEGPAVLLQKLRLHQGLISQPQCLAVLHISLASIWVFSERTHMDISILIQSASFITIHGTQLISGILQTRTTHCLTWERLRSTLGWVSCAVLIWCGVELGAAADKRIARKKFHQRFTYSTTNQCWKHLLVTVNTLRNLNTRTQTNKQTNRETTPD